MWSLNSNSILAFDCKQSDCKQQAARGEGRKPETEIRLLQQKPKNNAVCPQRLYRCVPEVRQRMEPMGSEIGSLLVPVC